MIAETPFINGYTLSYPIGYFPQLFAVVNARTKKGFVAGLLALEDEKKGGEGLPLDLLIEIIRVGLLHRNATATTAEATALVQDYLVTYGHKVLDEKIVDAFVDSGLYDRETVQKQRAFSKKIDEINEEREIALIKKAQAELDRLNNAIDVLIDSAIQDSLIHASDIPGKATIKASEEEDYMYGDEYEDDGTYGEDGLYSDGGEVTDEPNQGSSSCMVQSGKPTGKEYKGMRPEGQQVGQGGSKFHPEGQAIKQTSKPRTPRQQGNGSVERIYGKGGPGYSKAPSPEPEGEPEFYKPPVERSNQQPGHEGRQAEPIIRRRRPRPGSDPLEPPEIHQRTSMYMS